MSTGKNYFLCSCSNYLVSPCKWILIDYLLDFNVFQYDFFGIPSFFKTYFYIKNALTDAVGAFYLINIR